MSHQPPSLVGSIVERTPTSNPPLNPSPSFSPAPSGFPTVQHRSKSAFARAREARRNGPEKSGSAPKSNEVPTVRRSGRLLSESIGHENNDVPLTSEPSVMIRNHVFSV